MELYPIEASNGDSGGALRLQFNYAEDGGPNDLWNIAVPRPYFITRRIHDGGHFSFELNVLGGSPGSLYVSGGAVLCLPNLGPLFGIQFSGVNTGSFRHGTPATGRTSGSATGQQTFSAIKPVIVYYDFGFDLPMSWDGNVGDCVGRWWAKWTLQPPAAPSNLIVGISNQ